MRRGVLFLEDDAAQLFIYKQLIKTHLPEYPAYFVTSVAEAEVILNDHDIGLAVIDLIIPQENGADLIIKMESTITHNKVKLLVVSAAKKDSLIYNSLSGYIDGFITKLIQNESLVKLIIDLMDQSTPKKE